jgi:hypothetical protein
MQNVNISRRSNETLDRCPLFRADIVDRRNVRFLVPASSGDALRRNLTVCPHALAPFSSLAHEHISYTHIIL